MENIDDIKLTDILRLPKGSQLKLYKNLNLDEPIRYNNKIT